MASVSHKEVRNAVWQAVVEASGLEPTRVIVESRNDRRPSEGLYISLWWHSNEDLVQNDGEIQVAEDGDTMTQTLRNESYEKVRIACWGDDAYDMSIKIRGQLQNANRFRDLWKIIGFSECTEIQDVSQSYRASQQQRTHFNFAYYVCYEDTYVIDQFERAQMTITLPLTGYDESFVVPKQED